MPQHPNWQSFLNKGKSMGRLDVIWDVMCSIWLYDAGRPSVTIRFDLVVPSPWKEPEPVRREPYIQTSSQVYCHDADCYWDRQMAITGLTQSPRSSQSTLWSFYWHLESGACELRPLSDLLGATSHTLSPTTVESFLLRPIWSCDIHNRDSHAKKKL